MKKVFISFASLAVAMFLWCGSQSSAQDKQDKEVTVKGKVTCAKCDLAKETTCMTVVVEKKDGKDVIYYFDTAGNKKYHSDTCSMAKDGSVTGTVADKDGKKTITVKDLKYEK
jgi:ABC-type phosphate/phosphonate transport system substrate-binding protein